jgi:cytochrome P450 / NADPH-cytochrome P450 reductase
MHLSLKLPSPQSFICGSSKISKAVQSKFVDILQSNHPELDKEEAAKKMEGLLQGRYATDVFD